MKRNDTFQFVISTDWNVIQKCCGELWKPRQDRGYKENLRLTLDSSWAERWPNRPIAVERSCQEGLVDAGRTADEETVSRTATYLLPHHKNVWILKQHGEARVICHGERSYYNLFGGWKVVKRLMRRTYCQLLGWGWKVCFGIVWQPVAKERLNK